jgi:hypothetical protein
VLLSHRFSRGLVVRIHYILRSISTLHPCGKTPLAPADKIRIQDIASRMAAFMNRIGCRRFGRQAHLLLAGAVTPSNEADTAWLSIVLGLHMAPKSVSLQQQWRHREEFKTERCSPAPQLLR